MKYLVLVSLVALLGCTPLVEASGPSQKTVEVDRVNMANFQKVKTGQSLSQVEAILGKGSLTSESDAGMFGEYQTYSWTSKKFAAVTVIFQDGKVSSKSQFGLK